MIKSGREVIERALKGPEMQSLHKAGHGSDAMMKYTHKLGKCRWQVELFFKWIKQHLRIKVFYGTTENAVKTQI